MLQNMAIGNHEGGELQNVHTFFNLKKLASHPHIFAPVCYTEHWWIWVANVRKKKVCILDPSM
ncbi:hypothetical protein Ahy_A03g010199 [Arachis hypogaea]|uniref:Ubiquitin-like protease family profile domain-containing protein n=1 Tax=Arachis hypogaea TaxID=3818 RepID=A0A445DLJ1_ARAHY|nr:hypothetical protein Ahy_A03g010199 [Arachis hypogaea]